MIKKPPTSNLQPQTISLLLIIGILFSSVNFVLANNLDSELEGVEKELLEKKDVYYETSERLKEVEKKVSEVSSELDRLSGELALAETDFAKVEGEFLKVSLEFKKLEEGLLAREVKLKTWEKARNLAIRTFYKREKVSNLEILLPLNFYDFTRQLFYYTSILKETENLIKSINLEIVQFRKDKKEIEKLKKSLAVEKSRLANLRNTLASKTGEVRRQFDALSDQRDSLSNQLAEIQQTIVNLTARQQQLLAEKFGSFSTSVGEVPPADDNQLVVDPGFRPAFAGFSFGAPHRVGMSQYGAYGRSKAGQGYEEILYSYFSESQISGTCDKGKRIPVLGYGEIPLEDYLLGLGEMPERWGDEGGFEALKAQAVAARTYALNYIYYFWDKDTGEIKEKGAPTPICTTEACQVYLGYPKGGKWREAVEQTCGKILSFRGKPVTAWYASTAGGFTRSSGDVWGSPRPWAKGIKDTSGGGSWPGEAFEGAKYSSSPWFYKAWYKRYRAATSSRPNAWLTEEEMVDIINSTLLYVLDQSASPHLSQTDKGGPETWSFEQVRVELQNRGGDPINSILGTPESLYSNLGFNSEIKFLTDKGEKVFLGSDFRAIFNLRAPGEIYFASSLYNIEVKR